MAQASLHGAASLRPAPPRATRRGRLGAALVYARSMLGLLLVWQLVSMWTANTVLLPPPGKVGAALLTLAQDGELFSQTAISFVRLLASLALAAALAVPLGLVMGLDRRAEELVDPLVELLRPISGIAWIPLALFIFGIGHALPMFIMTYAAFFPILLGTLAGVRGVDHRLVDAARTMGVPRRTIVARVVVPAAAPSLLVALRLGVASAWTAVIAAELVGAPSGLGYAVEWYREMLMTPEVMAFIAMIGLLGYLCDRALRTASHALTPWARDAGGAAMIAARLGRGLVLPIAAIVLWEIWARSLEQPTHAPMPDRVVLAAVRLIGGGDLPTGLAVSIGRVFGGFLLAAAVALPLGLAMGVSRTVERNLDPIVESFRPIAAIAILPLAILWLGTGTPAALFIVAYAAFFPMIVNTVAGVKRVDRRLVDAARTMGVGRLAILRLVVLPGALPQIATGLRIAMGVAWTAIIAAELAVGAKAGGGGTGGVGQMMFIFYAYSVELNSIVVCMIAVGLVALALDRAMRGAIAAAMPWTRR